MKLSDFQLVDEQEYQQLITTIQQFNATQTTYPRDKTVHQVFAEQAARTPDATAVIFEEASLTYRELETQANQVARFLIAQGVTPETFVGVWLERSLHMVIALLGILKAGAAYLPIHPDFPLERIKYLLLDTQARVVLSEKQYIRQLNTLQWECPPLTTFVCLDSENIYGEQEPTGGMMDQEMWAYIARETTDDISGGGWKSSYTGEWLSREEMDEYGDNIHIKLAPYLSKTSRVFEIGCASGISLVRLAPLVELYYGTDLSEGILEWTRQHVTAIGIDNVMFHCLAAHEIDRVEERNFDVVILNSVIECFNGHNYLRDVLRKAIDLLQEEGLLFLGNLWDQDLKQEFVQSLLDFKRQHAGEEYHTKTDRTEELYIARAFLDDLRFDFPEIEAIEYSTMIGSSDSELARFGYDAIIRINKRVTHQPSAQRHKFQYDRRAVTAYSNEPLEEHSGPTGLAYVMYTSGTTGTPKGSLVEHRAILRLVLNTNYIQFRSDDRVLQTGSLAFDASTFEIWGPLLNGGSVCLPYGKTWLEAGEMSALIARNGVTIMWLTSSLFNQLLEADITMFTGLRTLLVGGEKLSVPHINKLSAAYPALRIVNGYGPTENTTFTTYYDITTTFERDIPIGKPIANTTVYILDLALKLCPVGIPGELFTGGDGLARGYLNAPDLTEERFIPHPFEPGERLYRTGDLARWLPDGTIEFLGRVDDQVKIRGYRIEPDEVEARLLQHPAVKDVVVLTKELGDEHEKYLVAYLTLQGDADLNALRENLKATLPDYMVPAYIIRMETLPLNANGKVDRKALPDPQCEGFSDNRQREMPKNAIEAQLVGIWEQVLGYTGMGVTEDFFDLGGHSLKATKLVALIHECMGITVPLATIFKATTIRELADALIEIAQFGVTFADDIMVPLSKDNGRRPIFAFPPGTGDVLDYIYLAELLSAYRLYAFNFVEADSRLYDYADAIMQVDANGPYLLFGYSGGGNLAYAVAGELERRGKCVSDIIMLDASRLLQPIPQPEEEVERIAEDFLNHESVRPYLLNPVLREKVKRRIRSSYAYLSTIVDRHTVQANIHVVQSVPAHAEYRDDSGTMLASIPAWAAVTQGQFATYQGVGPHIAMLREPYVLQNAELLKTIFDRATAKGGETLHGNF